MTIISPQQFYDELDNIYEIKRFLKRGNNLKAFNFLFYYFFEKKNKWISALIFQQNLCISYHSIAYQILSSFTVLNLLTKQKKLDRKVIFIVINQSYWDIIKKDIERKEGNNAGNRQGINV